MTDLLLTWNNDQGAADLTYEDGDLQLDGGLETAVLLSLFSGSAGGWWGDEFADVPGDVFGSTLYAVERATATPPTIRDAKERAEPALAWLVTDGVADSVSVVTSEAAGVLHYAVTIARPQQVPAVYRYAYNWQAQELLHGA